MVIQLNRQIGASDGKNNKGGSYSFSKNRTYSNFQWKLRSIESWS